MIYILMACLLVLLIINVFLFDKDITAPSFLITAAFAVSALCCCIYANTWKFSDYRLLLIVAIGLLGFTICSFIIYALDRSVNEPISYHFAPIIVSDFKLFIYLVFQVVLYGMFMVTIAKTTGGFSLLKISDIIGAYYNAGKNGETVYSSGLVNAGMILNMPGIYYMIYMAINNLITKQKNNILVYINIAVGMMGALLSGTRTTFFMYIVAIIVVYIILHQRYNGWKENINIANMCKGIVIVILAILLFNVLFTIQGRKLSDITVADLIANYIGAPLKNLELFIKDGRECSSVFGGTTLNDTYKWINEIIGSEYFVIPKVYKYRWVDGKILGNVYTQLMPLYNDFGIIGVFISMGLIGAFCQKIYDKIKFTRCSGNVDYRTLLYAYISFAIVFSFFSNKFFELVFARAIIYYLIGIMLFDMFFCHLYVKYGALFLEYEKIKDKD